MQVAQLLEKLGQDRPIFHSEADFQHALAWRVREEYPDANIRLEYTVYDVPKELNKNGRIYIDIFIRKGHRKYAIELKYKTRKFREKLNNEEFRLLDQFAQDIGRYYYLKDIMRLEWFVEQRKVHAAYAIFLTNDQRYWRESVREETVDAQFRIHEGRIIQNNVPLNWSEYASEGTKKGREGSIIFNRDYSMHWDEYSTVAMTENRGNTDFKYLLVEIRKLV